MSIDIAWETLTQGADGAALADQIRDFVHDKFQSVELPRFIKSVQVHSFQFGTACPEVEIKDISDPLPDFYEDEAGDDSSEDQDGSVFDQEPQTQGGQTATTSQVRSTLNSMPPPRTSLAQEFQTRFERQQGQNTTENTYSESMTRTGTPGIPGGTSNFSYFHHLPMGGLSGTQTPLAAVASGTAFPTMGWHHDLPQPPPLRLDPALERSRPKNFGTHRNLNAHDHSTRPSTATSLLTFPDPDPTSNPSSPEHLPFSHPRVEKVADDPTVDFQSPGSPPLRLHQGQPSDLQVVARAKYSGDVRMMLTAEILLDYPMPSFVGIPLKLSIIGVTFDGVAILAYIRKRMHFCFLDPEDAETLVGDHVTRETEKVEGSSDKGNLNANGLIQEIRIESEIGRQESGKQVLKNVGKVEKFVLEQIRKIFEEEFVFPSFWTFLV